MPNMPLIKRPWPRLGRLLLVVSLVATGFLGQFAPSADATTQNAWRWRNDDGSEAAATWAAAENTPITNFTVGETKRLRFGVANTGSESTFSMPTNFDVDNVGSNYFSTGLVGAVVDTLHGYAYFASFSWKGRIFRLRLSDFTVDATLDLPMYENQIGAAVIDPTGGFAYFASQGYATPVRVTKVRLSDFTRVTSVVTTSGALVAGAIDTTTGYAYFASKDLASKIIKIRLSDMTEVNSLTLNSGERNPAAIVLDTTAGYGYASTYSSPGYVVKFSLGAGDAAPARIGAASMVAGVMSYYSLSIDSAAGFVYAATENASPAKVYKVAVGDGGALPSVVSSITLAGGENTAYANVINTATGHLYIGLGTSPARIAKIRLSDFTELGTALAFNSGEDAVANGIIDTAAGRAYFGTSNRGVTGIAKVSLGVGDNPPTRADYLELTSTLGVYPYGYGFSDDGQYAYYTTTVGPDGVTHYFTKVRLSDGTTVGRIPLNLGIGSPVKIAVDTANGYAYPISGISPCVIAKVRTADMVQVDDLTLDPGENTCQNIDLDPVGGYGWTSTGTSPAIIVKFSLGAGDTAMTRLNAVSLGANENTVISQGQHINLATGYGYYPTNTAPARLVKVALGSGGSAPTRVDALTLPTGNNNFDYPSLIDTVSNVGYYVTRSPQKIYKINLGTGAAQPSVLATTVAMPHELARSASLDVINGFGYFTLGTNTSSSITTAIYKVRLSDMSIISSVVPDTYPVWASGRVDTTTGYLWTAISAYPAAFSRFQTAPRPALRLEAAPKANGSCADTSAGWTAVTAGSSPFKLAQSTYVAGGAATTDSAGVSNVRTAFNPGSFVSSSGAPSATVALGEAQYSEVEFAVTPALGAVNSASYCFRVTDAGTPLVSYAGVAEAQVASAGGNAVQTSVAGNAAPAVEAVVPSDASGSGSVALPAAGFTLNEGATRDLYVRGTVSDQNGCTDLSGVQVVVYRSGATGGSACTPDANDCYAATVARSALAGCAGAGDNDASFEVSIPVANFADPTDAGSPHAADAWKALATASDAAALSGSLESDFEVQSLAALSVSPAVMDYGTVALGATSTQQALTFTNVGNRGVNSLIRADGPMRSSLAGFADIASAQTHYSVSQATAWADGTPVAATDTDLPLALPQQVADAGPAPTAPAYFYLKLPATGIRGTYTNTMYFTAYAV